MTGKRIRMFLWIMLLTVTAAALMMGAFLLFRHGFGMRIRTEAAGFEESPRQLDNPNRGFYYIYDFRITDEETDYAGTVAERYKKDRDTNLTLIQICLQNYGESEISEAGMKNIAALFDALETIDKQLIVRFVYDTEGKNMLYEPRELDIVLRHMEQVGPVLRSHSAQIFTLQGLFVGNWGEMHGSRYVEAVDLRQLANRLAEVTDPATYLAVRTPAQWRMIMRPPKTAASDALSGRMGLFNDGMLGNESDYGTYGTGDAESVGQYEKWCRRDELTFQEEICCQAPNGGEVIHPNAYNDIERAIESMATMHVTYINREYEESVMEKWAGSTVSEEGCFDGMDGLTYIERHLGYRLLIENVDFVYRFWENRLLVNIAMKNVGFAPLYQEPQTQLKLYNQGTEEILTFEIHDSLRELTGGNRSELSRKIRVDLDVSRLSTGKYTLYLSIVDPATGRHIQLANEQEEEEYGYRLGELTYR